MRILLLSFFLSTAALAASGGMDGGGGQGVLCEQANGARTLRSLDLYEAENIWGYSIPAGQSTKAEWRRIYPNLLLSRDFTWATNRIGAPILPPVEDIDKMYPEYTQDFYSRMQFIPDGARLNPSGDAGNPILQLPPSCKIVQVLFYVDEDLDSGRVLVDREYWNLLSDQDKLAFYFHEDLYKVARGYGNAKDSRAVRKVVGLLFRDKEYPGTMRLTYGLKHLSFCSVEGTDTAFFRVPYTASEPTGKPVEYTRLVFYRMEGGQNYLESIFDTIWAYSTWVEKKSYDTSGQIGWTRSLLGSQKVQLGFEDNRCLDGKKACRVTFHVADEAGSWKGGRVHCRWIR